MQRGMDKSGTMVTIYDCLTCEDTGFRITEYEARGQVYSRAGYCSCKLGRSMEGAFLVAMAREYLDSGGENPENCEPVQRYLAAHPARQEALRESIRTALGDRPSRKRKRRSRPKMFKSWGWAGQDD